MKIEPNMVRTAAEMAAAFREAETSYALIGGIAISVRSNPRSTRDIDFLLSVPQLKLPRLLEDLRTRGFSFDEATVIREWTQENMTALAIGDVRVDWLKPALPAYNHILERATEVPWSNGPIRVATIEGLILLKLLAFRIQDQADIVNLIGAGKGKLDVAWIQVEWQAILDLDHPNLLWFMEQLQKSER